MERKSFIRSMLGFAALGSLGSALSLKNLLSEEDYTYPVLFIGHGSPMNGIEDNNFSQQWKKQVEHLPTPKAVLVHFRALVNQRNIHYCNGTTQNHSRFWRIPTRIV